jgi:nicotinamide mononucleotide (NMN) deamidase PncC
MITINEAVLNILKKHKLKIICCERGTNGMLSNLLSSKEADVFLAGYIFNNPETITKVFETKPIEKEPQAFIYE